jgi:hypothetical protein
VITSCARGRLAAFRHLPLAWRLFRRGRLGLPHAIAGMENLRRMMAAMDEGGAE